MASLALSTQGGKMGELPRPVALALLKERTHASQAFSVVTSPLGIYLGSEAWPPLTTIAKAFFVALAPAMRVLGSCDEAWESICTEELGTAFRIDSWGSAPIFRHVYRRLRYDHILAYCLPDLPNGNRRFVVVLRGHNAGDFTDAEFTVFRKTCDAFATELSAVNVEGENALGLHRHASIKPLTFPPASIQAEIASMRGPWPTSRERQLCVAMVHDPERGAATFSRKTARMFSHRRAMG